MEILKEAAAVAVSGSAANEWEVDKCMKEEIAFEEDTKSEWLYTAFMEVRQATRFYGMETNPHQGSRSSDRLC